jgi:hypothetical protein
MAQDTSSKLPPDTHVVPRQRSSLPGCFTDPVIDLCNLFYPLLPLSMFHLQDVLERPVEVVGNVGYLLVQPVEGVACYSPPKRLISTAKPWLHSGHVADIRLVPFSFMWR